MFYIHTILHCKQSIADDSISTLLQENKNVMGLIFWFHGIAQKQFQASISRLPWRPVVAQKRFTSCQSVLYCSSGTHLRVQHRAQQGSGDLGTLEISCVNYHKQVCITAKSTHSLFTTSLSKLKMKTLPLLPIHTVKDRAWPYNGVFI